MPVKRGIVAMPGPTESGAPSFTGGETLDLLEFFKLFDDLADACSLTNEEKCMMVVCYVDKLTKRFWISLEGYESHDYVTLKRNVLYYYPGAAEGRHYNHRDLASIVATPTNHVISTETELLEYYRRFRPVAAWLLANKDITARERDRIFWKGLPKILQEAINWRLQVMRVNFSLSLDKTPNIEDVLHAGRLVLLDADRNLLLRQLMKSLQDKRTATDVEDDAEGAVVSEPNILFRARMDEVEVLARKMHTLGISDPSYSALFTRLVCLAPAAAQAWAPPSSRQLENSDPAGATMGSPLDYLYSPTDRSNAVI